MAASTNNIYRLLKSNSSLNTFTNSLATNQQSKFQIKTKSIENTLLPLIKQISKVDNLKSSFKQTDKTVNALLKVGEAVNLAVERFVIVGETIAFENVDIKNDLLEACQEARNSGQAIKILTEIKPINETNIEKLSFTQAANNLLNAVIKVLLLADVVAINQIINAKNKVLATLNRLETVNSGFWAFVKLFTQYGSDMVELAHLTGERQNDLKNDKRRSQLSSARWILERSTIMILTASKTYFKHPDCELIYENLNVVYSFIKNALDTVHSVVMDSGLLLESNDLNSNMFLGDMSFTKAYRQFEDTLDLARNNMINESNNDCIVNALNNMLDSTQDFTDSLYIRNDQRERIIRLQSEIREQTNSFVNNDDNLEDMNKLNYSRLFKLSPLLNNCETLKKLLQAQTMVLANCIFSENKDATLLNLIKSYSNSGHYDLLLDSLDKFKDYSDQVLELCKLLRHISPCDVLDVTCEHHFNVFESIEKMILPAAEAYALYPTCKIANENLNVYCDAWESQINDLSMLVKEMQDSINGVRNEKTVYLSLPRPGKHGTSVRASSLSKTNRLDLEEQAKIAKLGLEMKLITSEIEAEAERWNEPQNEIVKVAKIMSDIAYTIHLFTKGEGQLKTTQDLFAKSAYFLQQGVILYAIIKEFANNVPNGYLKDELIQLLEKLPLQCQQLKNKLKQNTMGKNATFTKVDSVIQETRDLMNLVAKLVTNCFLCSSKYNLNGLTQNTQNEISPNNSLLTTLLPTTDRYETTKHNDMNSRISQLTINDLLISNPSRYDYRSSRSDSCGPTVRSSSLQRTIHLNTSTYK